MNCYLNSPLPIQIQADKQTVFKIALFYKNIRKKYVIYDSFVAT